MMRYFCTYFDHRYLPRGLALYFSLKRHCPSFKLWILCLDAQSLDVVSELQLPNVEVIAIEDFERADEGLRQAKANRSLIEYYFTCTPCLPLFILNNVPEVDVITYLDADLFFFSDPAPLYKQISKASIALIEHRFSPNLESRAQSVGIYNVGWLSFRRDKDGFACLHWWREKCIEWCHDRVENGCFADQKYLDDWPLRFHGVVVLRDSGANLASWNVANYQLETDGNSVLVDEQPLIFFHFHGFKQIATWIYDPHFRWCSLKCSTLVRRSIFAPYIRALLSATRQVAHRLGDVPLGSEIRSPAALQESAHPSTVRHWAGTVLRRRLHLFRGVLEERYILSIHGRVM